MKVVVRAVASKGLLFRFEASPRVEQRVGQGTSARDMLVNKPQSLDTRPEERGK